MSAKDAPKPEPKLIDLDEDHTHVRTSVHAKRPGVFVSHQVLFFDAAGEPLHVAALTYRSGGPKMPRGHAGEGHQDTPIPPGAAAFAIHDAKTSGGKCTVDAQPMTLEAADDDEPDDG